MSDAPPKLYGLSALELWMMQHEVSPRVLEQLTGIGTSTIYKILKGREGVVPTPELIEKLAEVTDISRWTLVKDMTEMRPVRRVRRNWLRRERRIDRHHKRKLDRQERLNMYLRQKEGPPRDE